MRLEARKIRHFDEYEYSYNGLMLVIGRDGIGIRDRYELILPAEYCDVEILKFHKPYCKVQTRDGWQIYDIVRQELLSDDVFIAVISEQPPTCMTSHERYQMNDD